MTRLALLISIFLVLPLAPQGAQSALSMPLDAAVIAGAASEDGLITFVARRRGRGGARFGAGGARTAHVSRDTVAARTSIATPIAMSTAT
jgi:hypothetical protein